jgi:protein O-GlcNAc transferase
MLHVFSDAEALKQRATGLYREGRMKEAAAQLERAVALAPRDVALWDLLGIVRHRMGELEGAAAAFRTAAALGQDPVALSNLGATLIDLGRFAEAREPLRRAVELSPADATARHNLAKALIKTGDNTEALAQLDRLVGLAPADAQAWCSRGMALSAAGRATEAVAALRESMRLRPGAPALDALLAAMHEADCGPHEILREARRGNALYGTPARAAPDHDRNPQRKIRIGYVSSDLCLHPVSVFFEPLLRHHDGSQVEVWCYASVRRPDAMTAHLRQLAPHWRDVGGLTDSQAAEAIRQDGIDILVDLGGHTPGNRLGIAALRPAPVACNYLGYPSTTGLEAVDYRLTDALLDPAGSEAWYSEELVRLAGPLATYQPPDTAPAVSPPPMIARPAASGGCTFGSFAARGKLSPALLAAWAEILRRVSGAGLRMNVLDPAEAARTILPQFTSRGVTPNRVSFVERQEVQEYLAAHSQVDIMLDTFPLSGHTTVCHALWMGVPAVCLEGRTCWQRLGATVLRRAGLEEWVARTTEEYVALAERMASDGTRLAQERRVLRDRMAGSSLMDHAGHARRVEAAYRRMWEAWCGGNRRAIAAGEVI